MTSVLVRVVVVHIWVDELPLTYGEQEELGMRMVVVNGKPVACGKTVET